VPLTADKREVVVVQDKVNSLILIVHKGGLIEWASS